MKQTSLKGSPLLQRIINWSSIIGALGTLAFCIWAYFLASFNPRKLCLPLFASRYLWTTSLIFLQILQTVVLLFLAPWHLSFGVFIYIHHWDHLQLHQVSLAVPLSSTLRECTGLSSSNPWSSPEDIWQNYIGWLNEGKAVPSPFFIFMMILAS